MNGEPVRYCFSLQVKPELIAEYTDRHRQVWPEMQSALRDTGWGNYSLFLRPDGLLIGYVECADLAAAQAAMDATEVNARWQAEMAGFFLETQGRPADQAFQLLTEVFHLAGSARCSEHSTEPREWVTRPCPARRADSVGRHHAYRSDRHLYR